MYTLSQRIRPRPIDSKSSDRSLNSNSRTVVLETFENLEDACVALEKRQRSRKNSEDFFIEFRLDMQQPEHGRVQAFSGKHHLKPHDDALRQLRRENERLRQERDILEKVTACFAKESR